MVSYPIPIFVKLSFSFWAPSFSQFPHITPGHICSAHFRKSIVFVRFYFCFFNFPKMVAGCTGWGSFRYVPDFIRETFIKTNFKISGLLPIDHFRNAHDSVCLLGLIFSYPVLWVKDERVVFQNSGVFF